MNLKEVEDLNSWTNLKEDLHYVFKEYAKDIESLYAEETLMALLLGDEVASNWCRNQFAKRGML